MLLNLFIINMLSIISLILAALLIVASLIACYFLPHPITYLASVVLVGIFALILLPKYQQQRNALQHGERIAARVSHVRHWNQHTTNDILDRYEIIATAEHPTTGARHRFVSEPLARDPEPHLGETVTVIVDWQNPKSYVMDTSFLPK
ncbi:MAG: hypothetical protein Q4E16_02430 [Neisseria sp.]|nr:hypothetical protein [Neisseria sp.]